MEEGVLRKLSGIVGRELFYIIREAVANAKEHTADASVKVSAQCEGQVLRFTVMDDGPGFDMNVLDVQGQHHRGIGIMQARALRIRSKFDISSAMGGGMTVRIEVPLAVLQGNRGGAFLDDKG